MKKLFLLFLLCMPIVLAEFNQNSKEVTMEIDIYSEIQIESKGPNPIIDYVKAELTFMPREDSIQSVQELNFKPDATIINTKPTFIWISPTEEILSFSINAIVKNQNKLFKIKKKIQFPLENIPEEYLIYSLPSDNIDSDNKNIILEASLIAQGEDDVYIVVSKIGKWVESNIEYTLDTLTAEVSQKSSWVLEERIGVCDEISSLFIAMIRSLGIPARYISGVAYTNWNDINDWGPHAWAEVYFPEIGWVPYDLTYGQFGYIDASHIKLKESIDSDEASTRYEWKSKDVKIETKKLTIKTKIKKQKGKVNPFVSFEANAIKKQVEFNSYNIIEVEINNLEDSYVTTSLSISDTEGIDTIGDKTKAIILKPNEKKKKEYWIVKIKKNLDKKYIYTFPVTIYNQRNITSETSFKSKQGEISFTLKEMQDIIDQNKEEETKTYSANVKLDCIIDKMEYYVDENNSANCIIKNTGNVLLEKINICLEADCKNIDLGISQQEEIIFVIKDKEIGKKEKTITAKNKDISKSTFLNYVALDKPGISIIDLNYPINLSYDQTLSIGFNLNKDSFSNPLNVEIKLIHENYPREWRIKELFEKQTYKININSADLSYGENEFEIRVIYFDKNNEEYITKTEFMINLTDVTLIQRINLFFNSLLRSINSLFV